MNRRYFFATALAAATTRRAPAQNDKVNIGVIGVGGRGRGLVRDFGSLPDVNLSYLCDADQASLERAATVLQREGIPQPPTTNDMRRLFESPDVDAVVVATPDHWHTPAALLACEAGKDVYLEKPCSHNVREGRLLIEAARYHGRIIQHGTQARSKPHVLRAIDWCRSGKLGQVLSAKAWNIQLRDHIGHKPDGPVPEGVDYDTWLGPAPWIPFNENRFHYKWHWHWHFGTGDAGNDGVHQIDIARWMLGVSYPRTVSGMGKKLFFDDDQQTPDTMNITFDYGEKTLQWEMRIWNPYGMNGIDNGVAAYGTEGMLHLGRWQGGTGFRVFDRDGAMIHADTTNEPDTHQRNFIDCVRSRKLPNADIGIGHMTALHSHLANIVARVNRTVQFDPETESIPTDPQANAMIRRTYRRHWGTPTRI